MRPYRRVSLEAVDAWLANRVGPLNPSPLAHCNCGRVSGIGCRTEGVLPKVTERAISRRIEPFSAKEPQVAVRVAPGCREPPRPGHVASSRNALSTVVSGRTCCSLRPTDPSPFGGRSVELPQVIEPVRAAGKPAEHPEIPRVVDPGDGRLTPRGFIDRCGRALRAVGPGRIPGVRATHPGPLPAAELPEVVQQQIRTRGPGRVATKSSKHPKIIGGVESGASSPTATRQVAGCGCALRAVDSWHVGGHRETMLGPSFRRNVEFPYIVQER